jgi:hypothetical protein
MLKFTGYLEDFLGHPSGDFGIVNAVELTSWLMGADLPIPRLEVLYDHF